jgi:hypothetical protein
MLKVMGCWKWKTIDDQSGEEKSVVRFMKIRKNFGST